MEYERLGNNVKIIDGEIIRYYKYNEELEGSGDIEFIMDRYIEDEDMFKYENYDHIEYYISGVYPNRIGGPAMEYKYKEDILNNEYYINGTHYYIGEYVNKMFHYNLDADQIINLTKYVKDYIDNETDFNGYMWESIVTLYKDICFKSPYKFNCIKIVKMIQEKFDSENVEAGYYYDATKYDPTLIKPSRAGRLNGNPYISEKDKIEILNICKIGEGYYYDEMMVEEMEKEKMSKIIGENKKSILEIKNCFKDGINEEVFRDLNNLQSL